MDNELILFDRLNVIRDVISATGEENFYISFSGGKDSTVLHYLVDEAIPGNRIPRVYCNTGIEYVDVVNFVKGMAAKDDRFMIIQPSKNIKQVLEKDGYPFKSKEFSHVLSIYQHSGMGRTVNSYLYESRGKHNCPESLKYQFNDGFGIRISDKCCLRLKKEPLSKWERENKKTILITGMMANEGGFRESITGCVIRAKDGSIKNSILC